MGTRIMRAMVESFGGEYEVRHDETVHEVTFRLPADAVLLQPGEPGNDNIAARRADGLDGGTADRTSGPPHAQS